MRQSTFARLVVSSKQPLRIGACGGPQGQWNCLSNHAGHRDEESERFPIASRTKCRPSCGS